MKRLMAHFLVGCTILMGDLRIAQANSIRVTSSWQTLADDCSITLPLLGNRISTSERQITLVDQIRVGQRVLVNMEYWTPERTWNNREFSGFVKSVTPKVPILIECEDAVYLLRKVNISKAWKATTLKQVAQYLVDESNKVNDYEIKLAGNIPDVRFDKFRIDNINAAEALQKIKEEYGLIAYFRDLELYIGLAYTDFEGRRIVKYRLDTNVSNENLTWRFKDDVKLKVRAIAVQKDNSQLIRELGDADGELRTLFYYNISDPKTLEKRAKAEIESLKFEGYEGDITGFLIPFVRHSDVADIQDPNFENRKGSYLIDEVVTEFGSGVSRKIKLGLKV